MSFSRVAVVSSLAVFATTAPSYAIDGSPNDYAWLGDGTTVAALYLQSSSAGTLKLDGTGKVPDSKLASSFALLRGLHFFTIGEQKFSTNAYMAVATFHDARVNGRDQKTTDGISDFTFGATWYPLTSQEATGTTLGLSTFLTTPTGAFEANRVTMGSGTWTVTPQVGIVQGLGGGFYFDGIADIAIAADHSKDGIHYEQDPSAQLQTYIRYQVTPESALSFGYSGSFGGKSYQNGVYTGLKTRRDQLRAFASTFITPSTQLQGMVGHDVGVEGGYQTDIVGQLRLAVVF